jgi:site-specific DNA recombinase
VVNEEEAKIIREAVDRILLGASLRAVCGDLNERDVQTVSVTPWTSTTLTQMVLSPRVIGYRVYTATGSYLTRCPRSWTQRPTQQ